MNGFFKMNRTNCVGTITNEHVTREQAIAWLDRVRPSREDRQAWLREIDGGVPMCFFTSAIGDEYLIARAKLSPTDEDEYRKQRHNELRRQIRLGNAVARPEDFPEIPESAWHSGTITLRGWRHGIEVGDAVTIDPENFARVHRVDEVHEIEIEDDDERPRKVTRLEVSDVQIDGDYAVLAGEDTLDITRDVIRMKSHAMKMI